MTAYTVVLTSLLMTTVNPQQPPAGNWLTPDMSVNLICHREGMVPNTKIVCGTWLPDDISPADVAVHDQVRCAILDSAFGKEQPRTDNAYGLMTDIVYRNEAWHLKLAYARVKVVVPVAMHLTRRSASIYDNRVTYVLPAAEIALSRASANDQCMKHVRFWSGAIAEAKARTTGNIPTPVMPEPNALDVYAAIAADMQRDHATYPPVESDAAVIGYVDKDSDGISVGDIK